MTPQIVEYAGSRRLVAGRTRYSVAPLPGTIMGPRDTTREMLVVLGQDGEHTLFGYATPADLEAADQRFADGTAPRSVTEAMRSRRGSR